MDPAIVYIISGASALAGIGVGIAAIDGLVRSKMKAVVEQEISTHRIDCPFPETGRQDLREAMAQIRQENRVETENRRSDMAYVRDRLDWIVSKLRNGGS